MWGLYEQRKFHQKKHVLLKREKIRILLGSWKEIKMIYILWTFVVIIAENMPHNKSAIYWHSLPEAVAANYED